MPFVSNLLKRINPFKLVSIGLYIISLFLVPFYVDGGQIYVAETQNGWDSFELENGFVLIIYGWLYFYTFGGLGLIWFANPLLILAWIMKRKIASFTLSYTALFVALLFLVFDSIVTSDQRDWVIDGTPGDLNTAALNYTAPGYWVWLASIFVVSIPFTIDFFTAKSTKEISKRNISIIDTPV